MSTTTEDVELHACQCGDPDCDELVKGKYARGHWAKAQARKRNLIPLPGPDEDPGGDEDLPEDLVAELDALDWIDQQVSQAQRDDEREEPLPDPPPGRIPPVRGGRQAGKAKRGPRVTVTLQRDVQAKIRMVLKPAADIWAIRDEFCGATFKQQEPEISEALAEIVCDSPDLLNWFTGPAGGYMKYFKLLMAVQPVAVMVWMHHVAHAERQVPAGDGQQPPQMANYAA